MEEWTGNQLQRLYDMRWIRLDVGCVEMAELTAASNQTQHPQSHNPAANLIIPHTSNSSDGHEQRQHEEAALGSYTTRTLHLVPFSCTSHSR